MTLSLFGVVSTYELYSVDSGDDVDEEEDADVAGAGVELRDLLPALDAFDPLGGIVKGILWQTWGNESGLGCARRSEQVAYVRSLKADDVEGEVSR